MRAASPSQKPRSRLIAFCGVGECCVPFYPLQPPGSIVSVACHSTFREVDNGHGAVVNCEVVGTSSREPRGGLAGDPCVTIHCGVEQLLGKKPPSRAGDNDGSFSPLCLDQTQKCGGRTSAVTTRRYRSR